MAESPQKLGILGGTFDPIHFGHLRAAEEIAGQLDLFRVVFIPAARPPHKVAGPAASFEHRLAMVRLAVEGRPGLLASDMEGRRGGLSYTVETLQELHRQFGLRTDLYFITGLDAFLSIYTWKDLPRLFELANFVVIDRPGFDAGHLADFFKEKVSPKYVWDARMGAYCQTGKKPVFFRQVARLDISSTDVRARLARGESIRNLVPDDVRDYIMTNGLYRTAPEGQKGNPA